MKKIIVQAKSKYPEKEISPYNPWAVCNESTGGKKENPDKFERCVHHVKEQNIEESKPARIRNRKDYMQPESLSPQDFDSRFDNFEEHEGDREQYLNSVWDRLMALQSKDKKNHEERGVAIASKNNPKRIVVEAKKKEKRI